jgi:hypothetical protein
METFLWLALALPAVADDFFTNLILLLVAPVIVVVGGSLVTEYLRTGITIRILLAVISFGFFVLYGNGLFMAIYEPSLNVSITVNVWSPLWLLSQSD